MTMKRLGAALLMLVWCLCASAVEKSATIVYINGAKYYIHTVQPGETLYALAKTYGVTEADIVANNPSAAGGLKSAATLKIPVAAAQQQQQAQQPERKLRKTFDSHYVSKGETLYAISRMYEIPIQTIMEDNPEIDPIHLRLGERILIRRKQIGSEDEAGAQAQWEEYRNSLNSVTDSGYAYHIVHPGETFYSLSRRFGISEEELGAMNDGLKAADLKAGAMIRVPRADASGGAETAGAQPDSTARGLAADPYADDRIEEVDFRALSRNETLRAALLLPLSVGREANSNYLDFYQGFLLGLDSVRRRGFSVDLGVYNTGRDSVKLRGILESPQFADVDLIVGPVYEEELYPVIRFAEERRIPVVSPLAHLSRMNSDVLFQLAPDPAHKYAKTDDLLRGGRRVTLIYTETTDREFEKEILARLEDREYERYVYKYEHPSVAKENSPSDLTPLLEVDADHLFVIMSDSEVDVDRILAALASADTSITSRGRTAPRFTVLGNARWNRYNNLDRTMFFKNRVVFVSTYHAKRDAEVIADFDRRYIRAFGTLPSLFSYRGFDTALIFCPAMFGDIEYDLEGRRYAPLQTVYRFGQEPGRHNHVNNNWMRVNYNRDFTITLE